MDQFKRKTAFVSDVEAAACAQAVETLRSEGMQAVGMACDVPDHESLAGAAARAFTEFSNIPILCNNATRSGSRIRASTVWQLR
jgi:NAD(P)-dependent dehydrogenase (short-subunit alcohol dehydrogenase family)